MTDLQLISLAGFLVVVATLYVGIRLILFAIGRMTGSLRDGSLGTLASTYTRPIRRWLESRVPRLYGFAARRTDPRRFTGLPLTLMIAAALYAGALFVGLLQDVLAQSAIVHIDQSLNEALAPLREGPFLTVFIWITDLASGPTLAAVAMVATGFLWALRHPDFIAPLWVSFLGSQATTYIGKYLVARPRPEFIEAAHANFASFPSGHTAGGVAVYGFIAYAVARDLPLVRQRFEVAFWSGILILLIAMSRMLLSVHFLSDVLAGLLVGGFWLLVAFALREWMRGRMDAREAGTYLPARHER